MNVHGSFTYNDIALSCEQWRLRLTEMMQTADAWEKSHFQFMMQWLDEEETIVVQTSGSSGTPKMISIPKAAMQASACMTGQYLRCFENTRALLVLPSSFIAGKMMLVRAMELGWQLTAYEPVAAPLEKISESFDFAAFTPMQLARLTENQFALLSRFGTVIVGGAAIPDGIRQSIAGCNGNLLETYGMAETLSHIAMRPISLNDEPFTTLPGVTVETDAAGRLRIRAPHISNEIIETQDVVELNSETSFYYRGRYDRVINSGGVKLFAEVIERKLSMLLDAPYYIAALTDETLGQRIVLYIESENEMAVGELKEKMKWVLDKYEVPKEIIVVTSIERTQTGKIKFK